MHDVRELILFFNIITEYQSEAAALQNQLMTTGAHNLNETEERLFHKLAEDYAKCALLSAQGTPGGADHVATGAALLVIQSAEHAAQRLAKDLKIPDHVGEHDRYAVVRATLAALTWSAIENGHITTEDRIRRGLKALNVM